MVGGIRGGERMNCFNCKAKSCLQTGRPCKMIESELRKDGIRGVDYIRPEVGKVKREDGLGRSRELPFSNVTRVPIEESYKLNIIPDWFSTYQKGQRLIRDIFEV